MSESSSSVLPMRPRKRMRIEDSQPPAAYGSNKPSPMLPAFSDAWTAENGAARTSPVLNAPAFLAAAPSCESDNRDGVIGDREQLRNVIREGLSNPPLRNFIREEIPNTVRDIVRVEAREAMGQVNQTLAQTTQALVKGQQEEARKRSEMAQSGEQVARAIGQIQAALGSQQATLGQIQATLGSWQREPADPLDGYVDHGSSTGKVEE
ncbi:hypothetical protein BGZ63DRAFT_434615 [Mariannaea sp. PMI_226]|nr:hypothetical protein BGZ63DRAFT_434615 [Mariannaea sp. PMI_226]